MRLLKRLALAAGIFLLAFAAPLAAEIVRYVVDGDTFILQSNEHVRMIGIDAPEVEHRAYHKKGEPFGREAKGYLAALIQGRDVELRAGAEPFDRFGRRLAYVYLPDGTFVNRQMVADGYAEVMRKFPFDYKAEFFALEREAREAKRGLWAGPRPWTDAWVALFRELTGQRR